MQKERRNSLLYHTLVPFYEIFFFFEATATCFNKTPLLAKCSRHVPPETTLEPRFVKLLQDNKRIDTVAGYRQLRNQQFESTVSLLSRFLNKPSHHCQCPSSLLLLYCYGCSHHSTHRPLTAATFAPRTRTSDTSIRLLPSPFLDTFLRRKDHNNDKVEPEDNSRSPLVQL